MAKKSYTGKVFLFHRFPEIEAAHKQYDRIVNKTYTFDAKVERAHEADRDKHQAKWKEQHGKWIDFEDNVYPQIIFDAFVKIKPKLFCHARNIWKFNPDTNTNEIVEKLKKHDKWDNVFGDDFSKLDKSQKGYLVGLVESQSRYLLADKSYYDKRSRWDIQREQDEEKMAKKYIAKIFKERGIQYTTQMVDEYYEKNKKQIKKAMRSNVAR